MKHRIHVNKQSKGKPQHAYIKPFLSLTGHTNVDDAIAANHCKNMVDYIESVKKFKASHPELLCLTPTGELAGAGSYETDGVHIGQIEHTKGWSTITEAEYEFYENTNAKLRRCYIVTTPANEQPHVGVPKYFVARDNSKMDTSTNEQLKEFECLECAHVQNIMAKSERCNSEQVIRINDSDDVDWKPIAPSLAPVDESVEERAERLYPYFPGNGITPASIRMHNKAIDEKREAYIAGATDQRNECLKEHVRLDDVVAYFKTLNWPSKWWLGEIEKQLKSLSK